MLPSFSGGGSAPDGGTAGGAGGTGTGLGSSAAGAFGDKAVDLETAMLKGNMTKEEYLDTVAKQEAVVAKKRALDSGLLVYKAAGCTGDEVEGRCAGLRSDVAAAQADFQKAYAAFAVAVSGTTQAPKIGGPGGAGFEAAGGAGAGAGTPAPGSSAGEETPIWIYVAVTVGVGLLFVLCSAARKRAAKQKTSAVIPLGSSTHPHASTSTPRAACGVHRTCQWVNEINSTAAHGWLNGSPSVPRPSSYVAAAAKSTTPRPTRRARRGSTRAWRRSSRAGGSSGRGSSAACRKCRSDTTPRTASRARVKSAVVCKWCVGGFS